MQDIVAAAQALAEQEMGKSSALTPLFAFAEEQAARLARELRVDEKVVALGMLFMDIKLPECIKEGKLEEHVARSAAAAKRFLAEHHADKEVAEQVLNCVEAHHLDVPFSCLEAEICANADCYKFLHPYGVFTYITILAKRGHPFSDILDQLEAKMDEKHGILSLDVCKKELEPHYRDFKRLIAEAKAETR